MRYFKCSSLTMTLKTICSISESRVVSPNISLQPVWEGEIGATPVRLTCTLSGYFPDRLSVEWKQNNRPLNTEETQQKLQSVAGVEKTFSLSSEIKPNINEWEKGSSFTCRSTHNGAEFLKSISICQIQPRTPPSIHVDISSFRTESVKAVKATCVICTGFDAEVTWLLDGRVSPSNTVNRDRNTTHVVSTLSVSSSQWERLKHVTCRAEHECFRSTESTVKLEGSRVNVNVTLNRPSSKTVFTHNQAKFECVITGQDKSAVRETTVTWKIDGRVFESPNVTTNTSSDGSRKTSTLTTSHSVWKTASNLSCSAGRADMTPITRELRVHTGDGSEPTVTVHILPEEDIGSAEVSLVCLVSGRVLQDYYIAWSEGDGNYEDGIDFPPQKTKTGSYLVASVYKTSPEKWNGKKMFSCNVWPVGNDRIVRPRGVSKTINNSVECDK